MRGRAHIATAINHSTLDAATAVVTAHDNVLDFQMLHGVLDHGLDLGKGEAAGVTKRQGTAHTQSAATNAQVAANHHVRNVAVHKHLAGAESQNLVGGHTRVRTSNEQVLGLLPLCQRLEVLFVISTLAGCPFAVVLE